jgi:anthranilate phosphoribosyltransferase
VPPLNGAVRRRLEVVAGAAPDLRAGADMADTAIAAGKAAAALQALIAATTS